MPSTVVMQVHSDVNRWRLWLFRETLCVFLPGCLYNRRHFFSVTLKCDLFPCLHCNFLHFFILSSFDIL